MSSDADVAALYDTAVESRYGGWDREPFADSSREIITIARRVRSSRL